MPRKPTPPRRRATALASPGKSVTHEGGRRRLLPARAHPRRADPVGIYEIRDGTGIGAFAPQFGPRRGFFFGVVEQTHAKRDLTTGLPGLAAVLLIAALFVLRRLL